MLPTLEGGGPLSACARSARRTPSRSCSQLPVFSRSQVRSELLSRSFSLRCSPDSRSFVCGSPHPPCDAPVGRLSPRPLHFWWHSPATTCTAASLRCRPASHEPDHRRSISGLSSCSRLATSWHSFAPICPLRRPRGSWRVSLGFVSTPAHLQESLAGARRSEATARGYGTRPADQICTAGRQRATTSPGQRRDLGVCRQGSRHDCRFHCRRGVRRPKPACSTPQPTPRLLHLR